MMHHRIQLAADLEIQLRDMVVNQGFIEFFHWLAGFADAVHKYLHRGRQALTCRSIRQCGIVQKRIDIAQACGRGQVDFVEQGGVDALFFQHSGLPLRGAIFSINRHQHSLV